MTREYMNMMHVLILNEVGQLSVSEKSHLNSAKIVALDRIFKLNQNKVKRDDPAKKRYSYSMDVVDSVLFLLHFNSSSYPMDMWPQLVYVINHLQNKTA